MTVISHPERSQPEAAKQAFTPASVLLRTIHRWLGDESGATAVEYSVLIVFIGLAILGALTALRGNLSGVFNTLSSTLSGT